MDEEYRFWYGVRVWKQINLFGDEATVEVIQDGAHIILKETGKFLCKRKEETVMEKMGVEKRKIVDKRIENTSLCKKCQAEWIARNSIRNKIPMVVTYETKSQETSLPNLQASSAS